MGSYYDPWEINNTGLKYCCVSWDKRLLPIVRVFKHWSCRELNNPWTSVRNLWSFYLALRVGSNTSLFARGRFCFREKFSFVNSFIHSADFVPPWYLEKFIHSANFISPMVFRKALLTFFMINRNINLIEMYKRKSWVQNS